jgi:hypothetical protein
MKWRVVVELDGLATGDPDDYVRAHRRHGDFSVGQDTERHRSWVSFAIGRWGLDTVRAIKRAERIGAAVGIPGRASRVTFTSDARVAEEQAWPDLIGVRQVAEILGIPPERVGELAATDPTFPTNGIEMPSGRVWPRATITRYAVARVRAKTR